MAVDVHRSKIAATVVLAVNQCHQDGFGEENSCTGRCDGGARDGLPAAIHDRGNFDTAVA